VSPRCRLGFLGLINRVTRRGIEFCRLAAVLGIKGEDASQMVFASRAEPSCNAFLWKSTERRLYGFGMRGRTRKEG
jgi:hypothetical protein